MANTEGSLADHVAGEVRAELARQQRYGTWMAKQMGMTQSAWSRRVTGDLPFDIDELERVAAILNVPISQFLGWSRGQMSAYLTSGTRQLVAA